MAYYCDKRTKGKIIKTNEANLKPPEDWDLNITWPTVEIIAGIDFKIATGGLNSCYK